MVWDGRSPTERAGGGGGGGGAGSLPRLAASNGLSYADLGITNGSTGHAHNFVWGVIDDLSSGSSIVPSATTSGISVLDAGIYTITWSLACDGMAGLGADVSLTLQCVPDWMPSSYDVFVHGGDPDGKQVVGSVTFFLSQAQIDAGDKDIAFEARWTNFDTGAISGTYAEVMIQRIA